MKRILAVLLLALTPLIGFADSKNDNGCTIAVSAISFGSYVAAQPTALDATGLIDIACSKNKVQVTIALSSGSSGNAKFRAMRAGPSSLGYQLYYDAALTQQAVDTTQVQVSHRDGSLSLYARVFAGQDVAAGAYADALTVTLTP